jgi:hypothetical protein
MSEPQEVVQVKGSKGLISMLVVLLAGGGIGATAVGTATGRDGTEIPTPYLSRTEVEKLATEKANRAEERGIAAANAYTAAEIAAIREACDKRLAETVDRIGHKLDKLDAIAEDVALLKGAIRAKGR